MNEITTTEQVKVVYNACYGGFNLSHKAVLQLAELKGIKVYPQELLRDVYIYWLEPLAPNENRQNGPTFDVGKLLRHDKDLVRVVEEMGEKVNGPCAKLAIETMNKGTLYRIDEYDGNETVVCQYDDVWSVAE
jgi:hypothetical protein